MSPDKIYDKIKENFRRTCWDRKERIYAYMKSKDYIPLRLEELAAVLDVPQTDMADFTQLLDELLNEGKIFLTKRKRFEASQKQGLVAGDLRLQRILAFWVCYTGWCRHG